MRGFRSSNSSSRGTGGRSSHVGRGNTGNRGKTASGKGSSLSGSDGRGTKPKGQIREGKTVQYSVKDTRGNTKYIGTTNNPTRRAEEHKLSGKLWRKDKLVVETKPIPRASAEKVEAAKLKSHRQRHGHNPRHNTTNDGKFHQPPLF